MERKSLKKRAKSALACALRMLVVFALAFSTTLGGQVAFAAGSGSSSGGSSSGSSSAPKPEPKPDPEPEPEPEPAKPCVEDLGIYVHPANVTDSIEVRSFASSGVVPDDHLAIDKRGGAIDFDAMAFWSDGSEDENWAHATFEVDDAAGAVATIEKTTGVLTAKGNGTVVVSAVLDAGYAAGDARLRARVAVDVSGQDMTPYVTEIVVCDEQGQPIDPSYTFTEGLATASVALQARVTVHDPARAEEHRDGDGADTVYQVTGGNGLAKQTGGAIADLSWSVLYDERGSVSPGGEYRPSVEGDNMVYARSNAGAGGVAVEDGAMVILEGAGHPQGELTIDAVWQSQRDKVVKNVTLSRADIEKLGTVTQSYTVYGTFGEAGFVTYTGRGVLLSKLLKAAGIDDKENAILTLRLDCFDTKGYEISWKQLVGKDRYYLPHADIGSEADAEQVAPMIAIDSGRAPQGRSNPVPAGELSDDDCFRLLFGVGIGDKGENTRMMQRRWINAIHVTFEGAPPSDPGDEPDPKPDPKPEPTPPEPGDENQQKATPTDGRGNNPGEEGSPDAQVGAGSDAGMHHKGAWSVLSAVNKNGSDVDQIEFDNPLRPFTAPVCAGACAAGGFEALFRFRRQKRIPDLSEVEDVEEGA